MKKVYPAIIHEEDGYWIEFPDLEGCQTYGETLEQVLELAEEALGLYLVSLAENNQKIPQPSDIEDIKTSDGETTYIYTDMNSYRRDTRAVKKMLSIPAWLAKEAEKNNISLSKILQEALLEKI
ncbi:MAG: type II toxin-antitoxin system HicB family antitoxin [Lachnospiraceae bacterium]|nr:type II toxin-antitoxin system HicB family antitoxin [Lachnospiraceae bacterium]